jgi:hypothetical protein
VGLNIPIPEEIDEDFRQALADLAAHLNRSVAAAIRVAIGEACRARGIPCPPEEALLGRPPGPRPVVKRGAKRKTARKPPR